MSDKLLTPEEMDEAAGYPLDHRLNGTLVPFARYDDMRIRAERAEAALQKAHDLMARKGAHAGDVAALLSCIEDSYFSMQIDHHEVLLEIAEQQRAACAEVAAVYDGTAQLYEMVSATPLVVK